MKSYMLGVMSGMLLARIIMNWNSEPSTLVITEEERQQMFRLLEGAATRDLTR